MSWKNELNNNITTIEQLQKKLLVEEKEAAELKKIISKFPMSISQYYLSLIDPKNPKDPIRKMCIPSLEEMNEDGVWDTSGETENTVLEGLQHKYGQTVLMLSTNQCAMYCRHCFRKRLVGQNDDEIVKIFEPILEYIKSHKEINNILISGGDALLNSNHILEYYLKQLCAIEHLNFIRIGTRLPVVFPQRISEDNELLDIFKKYSSIKQIYITTQFNHPNEITQQAKKCAKDLLNAGIIMSNQTVLLKEVNDNATVLVSLLNALTKINIIPYYIFQCRPVVHVKTPFQIPLLNGCDIIKETRKQCNGYAKRFKFAMSHEQGKIEIIGKSNEKEIVFKFHQAKKFSDNERIFIKEMNENQCWLDKI